MLEVHFFYIYMCVISHILKLKVTFEALRQAMLFMRYNYLDLAAKSRLKDVCLNFWCRNTDLWHSTGVAFPLI